MKRSQALTRVESHPLARRLHRDMRIGITIALFAIGILTSMTTSVPPAQAGTCEQKCNTAYNACINAGQSHAICQNDRADCYEGCQ